MTELPTVTAKQALASRGGAMLDLRSPKEFAQSQLPNTISLPLLNDDERHRVGLCYAERGEKAAIELGHQILSGDLRDQRVSHWLNWARSTVDPILFCWRGGLRSQLVQKTLLEHGVAVQRVEGGYKALRNELLNAFDTGNWPGIHLVCAPTGSGKTAFIQRLPNHLDLEGLARHKGSVFGAIAEQQPTQASFENSVSFDLFYRQQGSSLWLEDEGKLIGRCHVPEPLRGHMASADFIELVVPIENRAQRLIADYLGDQSRNPNEIEVQKDTVLTQFDRIKRRLGGLRHSQIRHEIETAFRAQMTGASRDVHQDWVMALLKDYYDPMYEYQHKMRAGNCLFKGSFNDALAFATEFNHPKS